MAGVVVEPRTLQVAPGGEAVAILRVRNTGTVVDAFAIDVLGEAAAWTTVVPPVLSLFPGSDGTAELHFRPPRAASLPAGPLDYAVRVVPNEEPDASAVEEAALEVLPYVELTGRLTPRTSETKRRARHVVSLHNAGNAAVEVSLRAFDPDDQLVFDIRPPSIGLGGGDSVDVPVRVAARSAFLKGPDRHRPFSVTAEAAGQPAISLDGTLVQRAGMPKIVIPLVAAAVVLGAFLLVLPAVKKDNTSGISLTSKGATTTTTTAADDPGAAAAGDAQAVAAPDGGGGDGGGQAPVAPAPGGGQTATTLAAAGAAPAGGAAATTTTLPVTETTAPEAQAGSAGVISQGSAIIHGKASFDFDAGTETTADADVRWDQPSATSRALAAVTPALTANLGAVDFDAVTPTRLRAASYSPTSVNGSDGADAMPVGTVIAVKTSQGHYAKVKITGRNVSDPSQPSTVQNISVSWVTYA